MELGYCVDKGIPHSEFLEWSPEDRAKVLAYKMEEAETCQMCGTPQWKWDENPYAYEPQEVWCKGCYLKDISKEKGDTLPGTTIRLIPTQEADRIRREQGRARRR